MKKHPAVSAAILLFLMASAASCIVVAAQTDEVAPKLQSVNSAFEEAFNAVLDAERAGANVTVLLNQLNTIADSLAQAEIAYRNGDAAAAEKIADSTFTIVLEVKSNAVSAENAAIATHQNGLWASVVVSTIGAVGLVVLLFSVWRLLKQRYVKNFLDAKPEVPNQ